MSVAYWLERDCSGGVVKPTWLLMMTWTVPPVSYPGRSAHVEHLLNDALSREGRVAVEDQSKHLAALVVAALVLLRAHPAEHHRPHELEVARIEAEREVQGAPVRAVAVRAVAEVVLDVATPAEVPLGVLVLELFKDATRALAHHVGEDVEPAAVGHADHHVLDAVPGGRLDRQVEQRESRSRAPSNEKRLAPRNFL